MGDDGNEMVSLLGGGKGSKKNKPLNPFAAIHLNSALLFFQQEGPIVV